MESNKVRVGAICFAPNHDEEGLELVGMAVFKDGVCVSALYSKELLEHYMQEKWGNLYQVPEYLSHVVAGMQELFWEFLVKASGFVRFQKIREFDMPDFEKMIMPLLEMQKQLPNGN